MPLKDLEARKKYARQQYLDNKDAFVERSKARRERLRLTKILVPKVPKPLLPCQECGAERNIVTFPVRGNKCKPCVGAYNKAYRKNNFDHIATIKKEWVSKHKEHKAAQDRSYALSNPQARRMARDKWDKLNPGRTTAAKAKNKIERLMRVPAWLTEDDHWMIAQAYELAALRTKIFGFPWHVDHIIPLKGKKVSGLHVPCNLQVIPARENISKNNKFEVANV